MNEMTLEPRGDREIVVVRTFNAPRDLVFEAFSKPELVKRWMLGTDGWSMPVCSIDFRVGGKGRGPILRATGAPKGNTAAEEGDRGNRCRTIGVPVVSPSLLLENGGMAVEVEAGRQQTAAGLGINPAAPAIVGREMGIRRDSRVIKHRRVVV